MGFQFRGVYVEGSDNSNVIDTLTSDASTLWNSIVFKKVDYPSNGIVGFYPNPFDEIDDGIELDSLIEEVLLEKRNKLENELQLFSSLYKDYHFTYIYADCFGGTCLYSGFQCKGGIKNNATQPSKEGIVELFSYLGNDIDSEIPWLKRGYFDA